MQANVHCSHWGLSGVTEIFGADPANSWAPCLHSEVYLHEMSFLNVNKWVQWTYFIVIQSLADCRVLKIALA